VEVNGVNNVFPDRKYLISHLGEKVRINCSVFVAVVRKSGTPPAKREDSKGMEMKILRTCVP
jgi:hypothetical protein